MFGHEGLSENETGNWKFESREWRTFEFLISNFNFQMLLHNLVKRCADPFDE
jgi:hypothetical protein